MSGSAFYFLRSWKAAPAIPVASAERQANGVLLIQVCTGRILRVIYASAEAIPATLQEFVVNRGWAAVPFSLLFSLRMLSMRTLFEAMAIPDRRQVRSFWLFGMGLIDMLLRVMDLDRTVRDGIWDACGCVGLFLICRHWLRLIGADEIRADWARRYELLPWLFRAPAPAGDVESVSA